MDAGKQKKEGRTKTMNKNHDTRNGFIHLYNPKEEGLGPYDVHYINAYKNINKIKNNKKQKRIERYVA